MTIITAMPPPEMPGAAGPGPPPPGQQSAVAPVPPGTAQAIPGPLRFTGRALRTLWSNGKARSRPDHPRRDHPVAGPRR